MLWKLFQMKVRKQDVFKMASSDKKVVRLTFNSLEELAKERDNSHSGRKCIQKSKSCMFYVYIFLNATF